jgi:hypothetical protein
MLHLTLVKSKNCTEVSCALNAISLTEMKKLDPVFCVGWIVGALGRWMARSNHPGSIRIESDSILKSIQVNFPLFNDDDMVDLISLPCFVSRVQYLLQKLTDSNGGGGSSFETQLKLSWLGWACFRYFESKNVIPDAAAISLYCSTEVARDANDYEMVKQMTTRLASRLRVSH